MKQDMERFAEKPAMNKRIKRSEKENVTSDSSDNIQFFKCGNFGHKGSAKLEGASGTCSANHRDNNKVIIIVVEKKALIMPVIIMFNQKEILAN
jgi:hypothetical protein